jgi:hypothetical protein
MPDNWDCQNLREMFFLNQKLALNQCQLKKNNLYRRPYPSRDKPLLPYQHFSQYVLQLIYNKCPQLLIPLVVGNQ